MAKKKNQPKRHQTKHSKATNTKEPEVAVYVHGWMFVVAFALMLGIGAVVGSYFGTLMNESTPTVAGVQTEIER